MSSGTMFVSQKFWNKEYRKKWLDQEAFANSGFVIV